MIDLHAGDLPEALEPFVFYDASPVEQPARDLALAYGLGHMVRQSSEGRTVAGSTSAAAADLGISPKTLYNKLGRYQAKSDSEPEPADEV